MPLGTALRHPNEADVGGIVALASQADLLARMGKAMTAGQRFHCWMGL
jgi:hypothetical protein